MSDATSKDVTANQFPGGQFAKAVDELRATAKWLLTIFAAIGGVLTGGIQLSSIGELDDIRRLLIALGAAVSALAAVGGILWHIVPVLTSGHVTLTSLIAEETATPGSEHLKFARDAGLLGNYTSVAALNRAYYDPAITQEHADALHAGIIIPLLAGVYYHKMRELFTSAVRWAFILGIVTAVAVTVFAWAANPSGSSPEVSSIRVPMPVAIALSIALSNEG